MSCGRQVTHVLKWLCSRWIIVKALGPAKTNVKFWSNHHCDPSRMRCPVVRKTMHLIIPKYTCTLGALDIRFEHGDHISVSNNARKFCTPIFHNIRELFTLAGSVAVTRKLQGGSLTLIFTVGPTPVPSLQKVCIYATHTKFNDGHLVLR